MRKNLLIFWLVLFAWNGDLIDGGIKGTYIYAHAPCCRLVLTQSQIRPRSNNREFYDIVCTCFFHESKGELLLIFVA